MKNLTSSSAEKNKIWRDCKKWANQYVNKKFPEIVKQSKQDKAEIETIWNKMSAKQKKAISQTKGTYIS